MDDNHSSTTTATLPHEVQVVTLLQLLSNPLILYHTIPYLPVSATLALAATSKTFSELIHHTPYVFRYLDLRNVKRAHSVKLGRIDTGGQVSVFRTDRYDETEEDFYAGPLRGIFDNLRRRDHLKDVQTLVLDGLSVPAEVLSEIILDDSNNVRLLSIREVKNLNERKFIQLLRYAIRPSRPENTPKLKGLYVFGPKDPPKAIQPPSAIDGEIRMGIAATIGSSWNKKSTDHLSQSLYGTSEKWFRKSGRMFTKAPSNDWGSLLAECEGIISFDAPLCTGPRHSTPTQVKDAKTESGPWYGKAEFYVPPRVANFALEGCHSCGKAGNTPVAKFGRSPLERFPLLSPVPLHSSTLKAAKLPDLSSLSAQPQLIARCQDCTRNRYCENCRKWWCEDCYDISSQGHNLHPLSMVSPKQPWDVIGSLSEGLPTKKLDLESNHVKGVTRECWDCGLNCLDCSLVTQQRCKICGGGYCKVHNEGSTFTTCDWCSTGRNRHRELY